MLLLLLLLYCYYIVGIVVIIVIVNTAPESILDIYQQKFAQQQSPGYFDVGVAEEF